jgi:hypothetical protein
MKDGRFGIGFNAIEKTEIGTNPNEVGEPFFWILSNSVESLKILRLKIDEAIDYEQERIGQ